MQCLEYVYFITHFHHVACKAQSRRTATYNSYFYSVLWCHIRDGDVSALTLKVGCETLQITDSYGRLVHLQMDTLALALFFLRTNATAYCR